MAKQSDEAREGILFATARAGNSLSPTPWEKADAKALRLKGDEGISDLQVVVSIAEKLPDEPNDDGEVPEWGTWGPTLRQINLWLPTAQDKNRLARVLLYCWKSCLEPKTVTIKDALVELSRVAAAQGWVSLSDVIKETKKSNKGGRPPGTVNQETTARYETVFKRLRAANPKLSDSAILDKVAVETGRSGWSKEKKANHRIEVKKALQRLGHMPIKSKKSAGK